MKKGVPRDMNSALRGVREFLESLAKSESTVEGQQFARVFSNVDEGAVFLSGAEEQQYRDCLQLLLNAISATEQVSPPAVERVFQKAIFETLDIRNKRVPDLNTRVEQTLKELRDFLTSSPQTTRVYHRVRGLSSEGLPSRIGNIKFVLFDEQELNRFYDAAARHEVCDEQMELRRRLVEELGQEKDFSGCVVAAIEVPAIEAGAAELLALRELRLTIDLINFYTDLIPYNHAYLRLPEDRGATKVLVPQIVLEGSGKWNFSVNRLNLGPLGRLSLPRLREVDSQQNLGFSQVSDLLAVQRNKLQDQIIASVQWAGRATTDIRKEEAFLLYAIALESMVLCDGDPQELTYRLRTRVAHLLEKDLDSRQNLFVKVGDLYNIRSKIVHSGRYQVLEADLNAIRKVAKAALIRISTGTNFQSMSSPKDLGKWFQDRVLQ